jgi:hypothetical protein
MAPKAPFKRSPAAARTSASDQNALRQRVEELDRAGGQQGRQLGGVLLPLPEQPERFWIVIDGSSDGLTPPAYTSWHQIGIADDRSPFDIDGGLEGAGTLPAYEINGIDVASGTVCAAWLSDEDGSVLFLAPGGGTGGDLHR